MLTESVWSSQAMGRQPGGQLRRLSGRHQVRDCGRHRPGLRRRRLGGVPDVQVHGEPAPTAGPHRAAWRRGDLHRVRRVGGGVDRLRLRGVPRAAARRHRLHGLQRRHRPTRTRSKSARLHPPHREAACQPPGWRPSRKVAQPLLPAPRGCRRTSTCRSSTWPTRCTSAACFAARSRCYPPCARSRVGPS